MKLFVLVIVLGVAASTHGVARHWHQTRFETVWRGLYRNCDYGYSVELPKNVLGHDGLPPASNHGIGIDLADPASEKPLPHDAVRLIWIWNAYAMSEPVSLDGEADQVLSIAKEQNPSLHIQRRTNRVLEGLPAVTIRSSNGEGQKVTIREDVLALRRQGDIVYQFTLVTDSAHAAIDEQSFRTILGGFRTFPVPSGPCSND